MKAKINAEPYDETAFTQRVQSAVAEVIRKQAESGIDIVTDGEQGSRASSPTCASGLPALSPEALRAALERSGRRKWPPSRNTMNNTSAGA